MKYLARSTMVAARMLGDEMVIMSGKDSTLFTLNPVATAIWNAADGRTTLESIVEQAVCEEFDVDRYTAMQDAEAFVSELSQHGILLVSDQPIAG
ncbi:MAG: PqqD family protein [Acidobacteriia bacterium]|nr:PqqD family protein [Terriglobia bacterium]